MMGGPCHGFPGAGRVPHRRRGHGGGDLKEPRRLLPHLSETGDRLGRARHGPFHSHLVPHGGAQVGQELRRRLRRRLGRPRGDNLPRGWDGRHHFFHGRRHLPTLLRSDKVRHRSSEHQPLQQRGGRQPVAPVQPRAGGLPRHVQVRHVRPALQIRGHPPAGVMGRRHHRHPLLPHVDPPLHQMSVHRGKPPGQKVWVTMGHVQVHVSPGTLPGGPEHSPGHHVPGRQLPFGMKVLGEGAAVGVAEESALAPERFGEEEACFVGDVEGGGVELDVFEVGGGGAGAEGEGDGGSEGVEARGIGGVLVDGGQATGGEDWRGKKKEKKSKGSEEKHSTGRTDRTGFTGCTYPRRGWPTWAGSLPCSYSCASLRRRLCRRPCRDP
mmetsp:Transcript_15556/g.34974  ORF Transcript_15556/g.34974 Transcript_15556/m.34974 type:complete len:381 (+) Transcript_15556:360-1502(+)